MYSEILIHYAHNYQFFSSFFFVFISPPKPSLLSERRIARLLHCTSPNYTRPWYRLKEMQRIKKKRSTTAERRERDKQVNTRSMHKVREKRSSTTSSLNIYRPWYPFTIIYHRMHLTHCKVDLQFSMGCQRGGVRVQCIITQKTLFTKLLISLSEVFFLISLRKLKEWQKNSPRPANRQINKRRA